ncbi:MAG: caspase family protein [Candidatus Obscuribacterales bacterium]|nr:caspase family protein [Candidatus Obscuribacterales bacterium]
MVDFTIEESDLSWCCLLNMSYFRIRLVTVVLFAILSMQQADALEQSNPQAQTIPSGFKFQPRDKWGLVVGASRFCNVSELPYSAKDAVDFGSFLIRQCNFKPDHVVALLNEKATFQNIRDAYGQRWLPRASNPGDLVVIFISTHGTSPDSDEANDFYVFAYDSANYNAYSTAISIREFMQRIRGALPNRQIVLVVDACYSAAASKAMVEAFASKIPVDNPPGITILCAGTGSQRAHISCSYENSIFTHHLVHCLRDRPNDAFADIMPQLIEKVANETRAYYGHIQVPELCGDGSAKPVILSALPTAPRVTPEPILKFYSDSFLPAAEANLNAPVVLDQERNRLIAELDRGYSYAQTRKFTKAERVYKEVAKLCKKPEYSLLLADANRLIGSVQVAQGRNRDALHTLDKALGLYEAEGKTEAQAQNIAAVREERAKALLAIGSGESAVNEMKKSILLVASTSNATTLSVLKRLKLSGMYAHLGKYDQSEREVQSIMYGPLEPMVKSDSQFMSACLSQLGDSRFAQQKWNLASDSYRQLDSFYRLHSNVADARLYAQNKRKLGESLLNEGRTDEAKDSLNESLYIFATTNKSPKDIKRIESLLLNIERMRE